MTPSSPAALIGNTPLLPLSRFAIGLPAPLFAKLEMRNLTGSDKDRAVAAILEEAHGEGFGPGGTVVTATSGNLALSLTALAVPRGYRVVLVMPEGLPLGRVRLLRAMGAEVVQTPVAYGMTGANARADAISRESTGALRIDPFASPAAVRAHESTADEIWDALDGRLSAVVVPVATGAMVSGLGRQLKTLSGGTVRVIAVQPASSPVLTGGPSGSHRLLGMGAPFLPENYDGSVVDEVISVSDNECHDALIRLYRTEGIASGPAGGAALAAAAQLAARPEFSGGPIVALLPDAMERYGEIRFWETFTFVMPSLVEEE